MRLFIAIRLPEEIRDYLYNLQKEIDDRNAKIRWVAKKNIHLTLKFIGNVDEKIIGEIRKRLDEIKYNRISISLANFGWFPSKNSIRVIWVGAEPQEKVIELQKLIDSILLDIVPGDQKFSSHMTLGRVKMIKNGKDFLDRLRGIKIKKMEFDVDEFFLISSELSRDGPRYEIVASYKLA